MITYIFLIFSLIPSPISGNHAIYISVTNLNINTSEGSLTGSIKIFSDDLEDALNNYSGERIGIIGNVDFSKVQTIIQNYINDNFEVVSGNDIHQLNITSIENIGDATWVNLSARFEPELTKLKLKNEILFELFDTQLNIIQLSIDEEKYYFKHSIKDHVSEVDI